MNWALAGFLGCLAGCIDSIAGGGGLITVPTLVLLLGPGSIAVGTNKVGGLAAAGTALIVYAQRQSVPWKEGFLFCLFITLGSTAGSRINPYVPQIYFKYLMTVSMPLMILLISNRSLWMRLAAREDARPDNIPSRWAVALAGLIAGFYDGLWGPGGGTLMFLGLLFIAKLPILASMALSKLANTLSAATSLGQYALQGHVVWTVGAWMGTWMMIGSFIGARLATGNTIRWARIALSAVSLALLVYWWRL